MRLTVHTDYGLRALIYLAVHQDRLITISEISDQYNISKNHMMKVAQELAHHGFVVSERGRNGGLRLARPPFQINLADVIEKLEADFHLVACFDQSRNNCVISGNCGAQTIMSEALQAFLGVFRKYSLQDAIIDEGNLKSLFLTDAEISVS